MKYSIVLLIALLPSLALAQPNIVDGKLLYEESCIKCHSDPYLSIGLNEMSNPIELSYMVNVCSEHFQLNWNQQDIEDTTHYLNTEFFRFDK